MKTRRRDVGHQHHAMRPGDGDVVVGQEDELHVEQQDHRHHHQGEPGHAVQEEADDAAALGAGDGLHEEEVVELQAQGMGALLGGLEHANGGGELERLAGEQHELADEPHVDQHEQDRRKQEEAGELDLHLQDGQRDVAVEQQVLVADAGDGDQQIAHQREVDEPGGVGAAARAVDGLEQAIGVDGGLGVDFPVARVVHTRTPPCRGPSPPNCADHSGKTVARQGPDRAGLSAKSAVARDSEMGAMTDIERASTTA